MDKMQFLSFIFTVLLSVTVHFIALRLGRAIMLQHTKIQLKLVQMIFQISYFFDFPDGNWPRCWIFKGITLYLLRRSGGFRHITMPNFGRNWSIHGGDIVIIRFTKWLPPPSWIFKIIKFYWLTESRLPKHIIVANFIKISQSIVKVSQFINFPK